MFDLSAISILAEAFADEVSARDPNLACCAGPVFGKLMEVRPFHRVLALLLQLFVPLKGCKFVPAFVHDRSFNTMLLTLAWSRSCICVRSLLFLV